MDDSVQESHSRFAILVLVAEEEVHCPVHRCNISLEVLQQELGHDGLAHARLATDPQRAGSALWGIPCGKVAVAKYPLAGPGISLGYIETGGGIIA